MNARQAAKKWKRKYEELTEMPMPKVYVEPKQTETLTMKTDFYGREAYDDGLVAYKIGEMTEKLGAEIVRKCGRVETEDDFRRMVRTVRIVVKAVVL